MRLLAVLGVVTIVLWLVPAAPAQPPSPSASIPMTAAAEARRPALPVIDTILDNRDSLGLTAAQVEALERLRLDLAREAIRRRAELMITQVDLDALLDGNAVDLAAAEARLRAAQKQRTELQLALIRAVETAKAQLTPDQRSRLTVLLVGTEPGSEVGAGDDPASPARGAAAEPRGAGGGGGGGGRPSGGGGGIGGGRPSGGGGGIGGGRPSGGGGSMARPPSGGGGGRPPGGGGPTLQAPSGAGRPPGGGATTMRPPSGGGRPPGGGGTAARPPGAGGGRPPGGERAPRGGEPSRPPDGHRGDGHRDHDGGRTVVGIWPSFWWDPWWEPYWWYYPPPPVVVQEPPVYVQRPVYWYYCRSAQAYYPYVSSCPEPWVPVPATPG